MIAWLVPDHFLMTAIWLSGFADLDLSMLGILAITWCLAYFWLVIMVLPQFCFLINFHKHDLIYNSNSIVTKLHFFSLVLTKLFYFFELLIRYGENGYCKWVGNHKCSLDWQPKQPKQSRIYWLESPVGVGHGCSLLQWFYRVFHYKVYNIILSWSERGYLVCILASRPGVPGSNPIAAPKSLVMD